MQPGDLIADRFELVRLAGAGGMGEVWQVRDWVSGEIAALKLLTGTSESARASFGREALILAELGHPGIVRYVAHGITPALHPYLVMEWLEGEDLSQRLQRGALDVDEVVAMLGQVAEALALAHGRGVVHRDLKPSNLYLPGSAVERVKVLDFGIAMPGAGTRRRMMRGGATVGTPGYMAPEQARGDEDIDARADMFALGCVAFECLTGRRTFEGEHAMAVFSKILLEEPPHVSDSLPSVPAALDRLVHRMLSKERDERPRDGAELADALRQLARHASLVPPSSGLTRGEQRVLGVVLVAPRPLGTSIRPPTDVRASLMPDPDVMRVSAIARERGAQLEHLADGSLLLVLTRKGGASDLAVLAAQCALAVRSAISGRRMALAIVRGEAEAGLTAQSIDRAARLLAVPGGAHPDDPDGETGIVLDEASASLLDARFELQREQDRVLLRRERVLDEGARTLLGKATECVGRDRELSTLQATVAECATESVARAVLVTAAAGAGKSRVRHELIARLRARPEADGPGTPPAIWFARGDPMRTGSSFGLAAQLLRNACAIPEGEPAAQQRQRLSAHVERVVKEDPGRVTEFLAELIGAPFEDLDSPQLRAARQDAMLLGDQIRRAFEDFIRAESERAPLVLVFDDLQWGDLATVKLMDAVLRSQHQRPLAVLAFARNEVHERFPELWAEREAREVRLAALTRKASTRLVRNALGGEVAEELVQRVVERAEGNAFYLEELIRTVAEGGGDALPETIVGMVEARLERLDPSARRILRAASVFGKTFWRGAAAELLGDSRDLDAWLTHLMDAEILSHKSSARFADEHEYAFRQGLLRDGAYAMLTVEDRSLGHRLAGDWLDRSGERDAMVLAEHYELGGSVERALVFYPRAAEQALEGNDLEGVLARIERAVACGAAGPRLGTLRCIEAEAHNWRGENAEGEACAGEAMALLPPGSPEWYAAAREGIITASKLGHGERIEAIIAAVRALEAQATTINARRMVLAWGAIALLFAGDFIEVDSLMTELARTKALVAVTDPRVEAMVAKAQGVLAVFQNDLERAFETFQSALDWFAEAGDLRNGASARIDFGVVALELGAYEDAEKQFRRTLAEAEKMGLHTGVPEAKLTLGITLMRLGKLAEARACLDESVQGSIAQRNSGKEGTAKTYLAMLELQEQALEQAERTARDAAALLEGEPDRALSLAVLARALLRQERGPDALAAAEEAMSVLRALGNLETGESLVRLAYAEALMRAGDPRAADAIEEAQESLAARAAAIANPQRRESFLERIEEHSSIRALAVRQPAAV